MRMLAAMSLLLMGLQSQAQGLTNTFTGDRAYTMIETLAAAGFTVKGLDQKALSRAYEVRTGPVVCHYTAAYYPDEWMSGVKCYRGRTTGGAELPNPLALTRAIRNYAIADAGVGNRWLTVEDITCSLTFYNQRYSCTVTTSEN